MHVGFVIYGPLDTRSGGYRYDFELVRGLRAAGDQVTIISLPERPYVHRLRDNFATTRRLCDLDVDVLLQDELCHPSLAFVNSRLDDDVPIVSVVHHLMAMEQQHPWRQRLRKGIETRYLRSVDAFVFNSETTRATVETRTSPRQSVIALPSGDRFSDAGVPLDEATIRARAEEGPLRIVTVGNLEPRKNVHGLVHGLGRVPGDWELAVVGAAVDARYEQALRRLASELGVADRVMFTGRLSDDDLSDTFRRSHLFAQPSQYEGFGIAALEAMGFGLPALVSTNGGAQELVTHRRDGFLVDPSDPSEITDFVAPLCRNRTRLVSLSLAARERFSEHNSWDETANTVREFLVELVE
ncbi:glycosyltransferase family 4 protein [Haloferax namakaokahaiae]|uniref:Glycosyltransferase family 4 protein n=1 Tax=Haloferax namakaokahaiae TaxID=1748331 RepID=A0ABD5ZF38_9EURY